MNSQTWYMITRRGEDDPGDQRDLDVKAEGFARLRVDHPAARRQQAARRAEEEIDDAVDERRSRCRRRRRPPAAQ